MRHSAKFVCRCNRRDISSVGLEHYLDRVGVTGSNPVCLTFLFCRLRIIEMNSWMRVVLAIILHCVVSMSAYAYEPGVEELRTKIKILETELVGMEADSNSNVGQVSAIKDSIIVLQDRIVDIKETTISGLRRQQSIRTDNRETLGMIAFGLMLIAVLSLGFVLLFGKRLKLQEGYGIMEVLANDLHATVSPEEEKNQKRFKVHFLVWVSVIFMFFSLVMYLFRVL
jgi:hypothetical protein